MSEKVLSLEQVKALEDPTQRACEAIRLAHYAEARAKEARVTRDDAIRAMRAAGMSMTEVAAATGLSVHTVKLIFR